MPNKFKVSLLQMNIVSGAVEHNLRVAMSLMEKALAEKPQVIVLPEMWSTDFLKISERKLAESTKLVLRKLKDFSAKNKVYILGSLPELEKNKLFNTFFITSPEGEIVGKYRKNNLFKLTAEHLAYAAGKDSLVLATPFGKWGAAICFDIRFPGFIHELAKKDTEILFVSAQWPIDRKEHWETLLRARAIENQMYVVGVNRVGKSNGLEYPGTSLVFDPWGDILAEGSTGEEIITCQLDLNKIKEVRKKLPMF